MRLIDADEMAVNETEAYMSAQIKLDNPITLGLNSCAHRKMQQLIADTPTVDAVPVVRCKDCKYFSRDKEYNRAWCNYSTGSVETAVNGFCFRGVRKDGGTDNG